MKKKRVIRKSALLMCLIYVSNYAVAQAVGPGRIEGGFGVDADLTADTALHGSAASTSGKPSDDWFKSSKVRRPLTGLGIIDTTGAFYFRNLLRSSSTTRRNLVFSKPMSVPKLTRSNGGTILLDALYARDQADVDKTSITGPGGVKLIDDPSTWIIGSSSMGAKTDILEFFSHMRRKGTTVKDSLFFYYGVAIFGTSGSKNISAELFVRDVRLDTTINKLINLGSQGGRTAWWLSATGKVVGIGDLAVLMDYTGGVFTLRPQIWVRKSTFDSFSNGSGRSPANFRFGNFYGQGTLPTSFGYAEILPRNGGTTLVAQGTSNTLYNFMSTPWGSASAGGYAWDSVYTNNQFIEMSVNFTALGVDPAYFDGIDPCTIPYRTLMFYSQSSLAPTSSPKDFAGPYPFWRYPRVISKIKGTDTLNCTIKTGSVYADSAYPLAWYKWTTTYGRITGYNADSTVITFNKPGKYYLETAPLRGCYTLKDSVVILADTVKPVASARYLDTLSKGTVFTIRLLGGNVPKSDSLLNSPVLGPAGGYSWQWTGPVGFTSTVQSPWISNPGIYSLRMTSLRNTCFDTTSTFVILLPVVINYFDCKAGDKYIGLRWEAMQEQGLNAYIVEKFRNGIFEPIGRIPIVDATAGVHCYRYTDMNPEKGWNSYRLVLDMQIPENNLSLLCASHFESSAEVLPVLSLLEHPLNGAIRFKLQGLQEYSQIEIKLCNASGAVILKDQFQTDENNEWRELKDLPQGMYTLSVVCNEKSWVRKVLVR